ncbi:hypothetical protein ACF0H5_001841 [Mactra antiquata]
MHELLPKSKFDDVNAVTVQLSASGGQDMTIKQKPIVSKPPLSPRKRAASPIGRPVTSSSPTNAAATEVMPFTD